MKFKCHSCEKHYNTYPDIGAIVKNIKNSVEFYCYECSCYLFTCIECKKTFHTDFETCTYVEDLDTIHDYAYFCENCYDYFWQEYGNY